MNEITIQLEPYLQLEDFVQVLNESGLADRRPMEDRVLLQNMLKGSNLIVTAKSGEKIIGVLRGLTDHCYRCFIADLAVSKEFQGKGVGRRIIQFTRELSPTTRLFLFSAEEAVGFYQKLGFHIHERCYQLKAEDNLL